MLRSLYSAISGLHGHQEMLDVIANNIANVNTTGYKASRVSFEDILSQTEHGATAPSGGLGGINPAQVGLGMTVAGIDVLQTQGNLQSTGKLTDMAIQGDGFFVLSDGAQQYYTRDGSFDTSLDGSLVNPASGLKVQGWQADSTGTIDTTGPLKNLVIPIGQQIAPQATANATVTGNLDASATQNTSTDPANPTAGSTVSTTLTVYDSLGASHQIDLTFTNQGSGAWNVAATDPNDPTDKPSLSVSSLSFTSTSSPGTLDTSTTSTLTLTFGSSSGSTTTLSSTVDFSSMTQFAAPSDPSATADGYPSGQLTTFSVGSDGQISGVYSNGHSQVLGQIALASFRNPAGLLRDGDNNFITSSASGQASVGVPGSGDRGSVLTGTLEMSNVDLATEFTEMIAAQRGFEANTRVITTSDQMLQDLVNLRQ